VSNLVALVWPGLVWSPPPVLCEHFSFLLSFLRLFPHIILFFYGCSCCALWHNAQKESIGDTFSLLLIRAPKGVSALFVVVVVVLLPPLLSYALQVLSVLAGFLTLLTLLFRKQIKWARGEGKEGEKKNTIKAQIKLWRTKIKGQGKG
jgi:hypothetical protein